MFLEIGDQLLGSDLRFGQMGHRDHYADADRGGVGVQETAPGYSPGAPEHLDVHTLVVFHAETLVDHAGRELEHLFHPERVVGGLGITE